MVSVPGQGALDASGLVNDPKNYLLMVDGFEVPGELGRTIAGAIFFAQHDSGIFEVHTNFLKPWRGQFAIDASLAAYRWMFTRTEAMTLLARAPACWPGVGRFCEAVGATFEFSRAQVWPSPDGLVDCAFYALRYDDWIQQTDELLHTGSVFHLQYDAECARLGQLAPLMSLDRYLGVFAEMLYGGQPDKAVILYNRFARFGGFPGITLLARDPVIIDIGTAVLQIGEGAFRALKVRT